MAKKENSNPSLQPPSALLSFTASFSSLFRFYGLQRCRFGSLSLLSSWSFLDTAESYFQLKSSKN